MDVKQNFLRKRPVENVFVPRPANVPTLKAFVLDAFLKNPNAAAAALTRCQRLYEARAHGLPAPPTGAVESPTPRTEEVKRLSGAIVRAHYRTSNRTTA